MFSASEEPEAVPEDEERLGREHKRGNRPATLAPLNQPAEPARHEQIREENTDRYDPAPGPADTI